MQRLQKVQNLTRLFQGWVDPVKPLGHSHAANQEVAPDLRKDHPGKGIRIGIKDPPGALIAPRRFRVSAAKVYQKIFFIG